MKKLILIIFIQLIGFGCEVQINADHIKEGNELLMNNDIDGAIGEFNYALFLDSSKVDAYRGLIYCYISTNEPEKALLTAEKFLQYEPNSFNAYNERGNVHLILKQFDLALLDYDMATAIDSSKVLIVAFNKAECLRELQKYDEAIKYYDKVIYLDSLDRRAIYKRGLSRYLSGQTKEACYDYKKAFELGDVDAESAYNMNCK